MVQSGFKECPFCYEEIKEKAKVCRFCHAVLANESIRFAFAGMPPEHAQTPDEYDTLATLVEKEFEAKGIQLPKANGDRIKRIVAKTRNDYRVATVLTVDLCGHRELSPQLPVNELKQCLETFYGICVHAISLHNGFLVKLIGDSILAVFGAPVTYERDVESAIQSSIEIRDEVNLLPSRQGVQFSIKAGLHTGEILSSILRTHEKDISFDVFGNAVDTACGLQARAGEGEILASEDTHALVKDRFRFQPRDSSQTGHSEELQHAYAVLGTKQEPVLARTFEVPLLGRDEEMERICSFLSAPADQARIIAITGEPGTGKSRLLHEAKLEAPQGKCYWLEGRPERVQTPYFLFGEFLRHFLGLRSMDSKDVWNQVSSLPARFPQFSSDDLSYLRYLLGDGSAIEHFRQSAASTVRDNLKSIFQRLLSVASGEEGLLVCIDDLQWVDDASLRLLRELFEESPVHNDKWIVSYRSGFQAGWAPTPHIQEILLGELSEEARETLLSYLLNHRHLLPEMNKVVAESANGNPLYIEQVVRAFLEKTEGVGQTEDREQESPMVIHCLPGSLRELIQSRIDSLQEQTRLALQCAAVLGQRFALELFIFFDEIRDNLLKELYTLQGLEFLQTHRTQQEVEFLFTHPLVQEVTYQSLRKKRRAELHLLIARRLEEAYQGREHELYDVLAYHYGRTQNTEKAVYYLQKAGDRARLLYANRNALELYEEALSKLDELSPTPERQKQIARLLIERGRIHRLLGELENAVESFEACEKIVSQLGDVSLRGHCLYELGLTAQHLGHFEEAKETLKRSLDIWQGLKDETQIRVAQNALGLVAWTQGDLDAAERAFSEVLTDQGEEDVPPVLGDASNNLALVYWKWGNYEKARDCLLIALRCRQAAHNRFGIAATLMNLGIVEEQIGRYEQAEEDYSKALKLMRQLDYRQGLTAVFANLANLELKRRNYHHAQEYSTQSLSIARQIGDRRSEAIALENIALGYAALGQTASAEEHFDQALELAQDLGDLERVLSARLGKIELLIDNERAKIDTKEVNQLLEDIRKSYFAEMGPRGERLCARVLERKGSSEEALASYQAALQSAKSIHNNYEIRETLVGLISLCQRCKVGNWGEYERQLAQLQPA